MLPASPPALGASLMRGVQLLDGSTSWLWEDRLEELVPPGPLSQKPLGTCRPAPAWEELSELLGRDTGNLSAWATRTQSEVCTPRTPSSPSRGFGRSCTASSRCQTQGTAPLQQLRQKAHGVWRPASKLTLAQADGPVSPGSTAMWRGLGLDSSLEKRQRECLEMARHRQECAQKKKKDDRARAKAWLDDLVREEELWSPTAWRRATGAPTDASGAKTLRWGSSSIERGSDNSSGGLNTTLESLAEAPVGVPPPRPKSPRIERLERPSTPSGRSVAKLRSSLLEGKSVDKEVKKLQVRMGKLEHAMMMLDEGGEMEESRRASKEAVPKGRSKIVQRQKTGPLGQLSSAKGNSSDEGDAKNLMQAALTDILSDGDNTGDEEQDKTNPEDPKGVADSGAPAGILKTSKKNEQRLWNRRTAVTSIQEEIDGMGPSKSEASGKARPKFERKRSLISRSRMRRLLERRKQEFAAWCPSEQARLRSAFQGSDPSGLAVLDARGLRHAFAELGLAGRNRNEKEAISAIAREAVIRGNINFFDFVFQLVPEVEQKLEELRSPKLYAEFQLLDVMQLGRLKEQQCLEGLEKHARGMEVDEESQQTFWKCFVRDFPEMYMEQKNADNAVDFKGFQYLVATMDARRADFMQRLEKRIAQMACLPANLEALHGGELCYLSRIFDNQDIHDAKSLSCDRMTVALLNCGVGVPVGQMWDRMMQVMDECEGFAFSFKDFLSLIDGIREEKKVLLKTALTHLFKGYAWNSQQVTSSQVPALMTEIVICKDCCYQIEELVTIVESCDKDVNGTFDMDGLVTLISKVAERTRAMQRESEAVVAKQLGFNFSQVLRMRRSFAALTCTGAIGIPEIRMWFQEINPHVEPTNKQIEALIEEFSPMMGNSVAKSKSKKERSTSGNPDERKGDDASEAPGDQEAGGGGSQCGSGFESDSSEGVDVETALEAMASAPSVHQRKSLHEKEKGEDESGILHESSHRISSLGLEEAVAPEAHQESQASAPASNQETATEEAANQPEERKEMSPKFRKYQMLYCSASGNVLYFEGYMRLMHRLLKT